MRLRAPAWFDGLFGDPARRPLVSARRQAVIYAALGLIGFAAAFLRLPAGARATLWTEDAGIFLEQAYRLPLGSAIVHGYAGYAHLFPRLVAASTAEFIPLALVPIVTTVIMAALLSALALAVLYLSASQLTTWTARLVLWGLVVAAPLAGMEIALSTANFQWYLLATAFFAVVARRPGAVGTVLTSLLAGLAIASSALALLFVFPLVLLRAARFRTRGDLVLAGVAIAAAALQLAVVLQGGRTPAGAIQVQNLPPTYLIDVLGVAWAGPVPVRAVDAHAPILYGIVAVLGLAVTVGLAWWARRTSTLAVVAIACSFVACAVIGVLSGFVGPDAFWLEIGIGTRYFVLPVFLVGLALVVVIDALMRDPRRLARGIAVVLIGSQLLAVAINYPQNGTRVTQYAQESWAHELQRARSECDAGAADVYVRGSARSPFDYDALIVPCRAVLGR